MSKKIKMINAALILVAGSANAVNFTGDGVDNLFSTAGNWDTVPIEGDSVYEIGGGSSSENRIQVDSLWMISLGQLYIKQVHPSPDWAYVEVLDGATLSSVTVGLGQNASVRKGDLVLRAGATLIGGNGGNSGSLSVGNADRGDGILTVEAGVSFSGARLDLQETGTLIFEFGVDSVSTFTSTRTTTGNANYLDGVLQLDLDALNTVGSYTLIDGNSDNLLIDGALISDLTAAGGSISDSLTSSHFNVLNEGDIEWNVTTANSGQDLVLNVISIPEPTTLGMLGLTAAGLFMVRRMNI